MFWKDLSWKVQTEAMGHSFQTTSFSSRPLRSLRDLVLVNFGGLLLPALRVCCLLLGEGKRPLVWGVGRQRPGGPGCSQSAHISRLTLHPPTHTRFRACGILGLSGWGQPCGMCPE